MKRIISANYVSTSATKYYHYDNRRFNIKTRITPGTYIVDPPVVAAYTHATGLDCSSVLYMLDVPNEEYFESYKYEYIVTCEHPVQVFMDYSYMMCISEEDYAKKMFEKRNDTKYDRSEYINLMATAYLGDVAAMKILAKEYGYSSSEKQEYISKDAVVVSRRTDPER